MKLRKVFAGIAAAATMLGGLALGATTANAAPETEATITINNAQEGHTYTGYKFATFANYDATNESVEVNTVPAWLDAVKTAADKADGTPDNSIPSQYAQNPAAYVATFTPAQLRAFADALVVPTGQEGTVAADGTITATEGWFLVTDMAADGKANANAVVATAIDDQAGAVTVVPGDGQSTISTLGQVNAKSVGPDTPDKSVDKKNAGVGDKLTYTVPAVVPADYVNYADGYVFTLTDTLSKGQDFNNDVKVGETDVKLTNKAEDETATTNYYQVNADGTTTVVVDLSSFITEAGETLTVTYSATVNADATDKVTNKANLSNNAGTSGDGTTNVEVGTFAFTKIGVDGDKDGLADAEFQVKDSKGNVLNFTTRDDGTYVYSPTAAADGSTTTKLVSSSVEGKKGQVKVDGLADGTYTVEETKAPTGYAQNFKVTFTVTITNGNATLTSNMLGQVDTTNKTVLNVKKVTQLPLTGAAGTALFTLVGVLLAGAAVTVFAKSRSTKRALTA